MRLELGKVFLILYSLDSETPGSLSQPCQLKKKLEENYWRWFLYLRQSEPPVEIRLEIRATLALARPLQPR